MPHPFPGFTCRSARNLLVPLAVGVLALSAGRSSGQGKDGEVLSREPFALTTKYADQDELTRFRFPKEVYEEAQKQTEFAGEKVVYRSGGLKVVGFVYGPKEAKGAKRPAIVYCRGGTSDFGQIEPSELVTFHQWAKAGFVVLATNYRGGGGSEGVDEWGGADVDDVLNLVPVARSLPGVDADNLFLVGLSRGGPMAYIALKRKMPVRAAAVMAGVTDLKAKDMQRKEFVDGDDPVFRKIGWPGWKTVWPEYEAKKDEHLKARSAVDWADRIDAPVLILHARDDPRVPVEHALALATKLQAAKKEYELVVYAHDGHSLPLNREDRDRRIVNWFRTHAKAEGK